MGWHVGVVGTGQWSRVHLSALSANPHVERITLAGRNAAAAAKLAEEFPKVRATVGGIDALCTDRSIELVHVVVPHHLHAQTALAALEAGKHVICEKPGSTRLEDFDRLRAVADSSGRRLLVVLNQLYNPVARRVRELIDQDALGRVFLSVENAYSNAGGNYRNPDAWRTTIDQAGGGILIDGGFHMVYRHLDYLARYGPPKWVLADTPQLAVSADGQVVPEKGEDFVSITVGYGRPLRIQWSHGWTLSETPERSRQCFIAGTEGTLELTDRADEQLVLAKGGQRDPMDVAMAPTTPEETTHVCLLDYLDALVEGRASRYGSLDLARTALATILAAYESGRTGKRVRVG